MKATALAAPLTEYFQPEEDGLTKVDDSVEVDAGVVVDVTVRVLTEVIVSVPLAPLPER